MPTPVSNRIGISINSELEPGCTISLNLVKGVFLEVDGLCLTRKRPTGIVPQQISEKGLSDLKRALEENAIVVGSEPIPLPTNAEDEKLIEKSVAFLTEAISEVETCLKVNKVFASMSGRKRPLLYETLLRMREIEWNNARRSKVLARIELHIAKVNGISSVIEEKLEEVHISDTLIKQQREAAAAAAAASISTNPDI
jgi:hypothetical protein